MFTADLHVAPLAEHHRRELLADAEHHRLARLVRRARPVRPQPATPAAAAADGRAAVMVVEDAGSANVDENCRYAVSR